MKGRKQINMPGDVVKILDDFAERGAKDIFPTKEDVLSYPDTIRYMASKLDPKKYGKK